MHKKISLSVFSIIFVFGYLNFAGQENEATVNSEQCISSKDDVNSGPKEQPFEDESEGLFPEEMANKHKNSFFAKLAFAALGISCIAAGVFYHLKLKDDRSDTGTPLPSGPDKPVTYSAKSPHKSSSLSSKSTALDELTAKIKESCLEGFTEQDKLLFDFSLAKGRGEKLYLQVFCNALFKRNRESFDSIYSLYATTEEMNDLLSNENPSLLDIKNKVNEALSFYREYTFDDYRAVVESRITEFSTKLNDLLNSKPENSPLNEENLKYVLLAQIFAQKPYFTQSLLKFMSDVSSLIEDCTKYIFVAEFAGYHVSAQRDFKHFEVQLLNKDSSTCGRECNKVLSLVDLLNIKKIKDITSNIAAIAAESRVKAQNIAAYKDYINKPFDSEQIFKIVTKNVTAGDFSAMARKFFCNTAGWNDLLSILGNNKEGRYLVSIDYDMTAETYFIILERRLMHCAGFIDLPATKVELTESELISIMDNEKGKEFLNKIRLIA